MQQPLKIKLMSRRLNQAREKRLQPRRLTFAKNQLTKLGFTIQFIDETQIHFLFNEHLVMYYPYSGWHTGKTIKDGRGWIKLLNQIKP